MQNISRVRQKKDCAGRMYVNMLLLIPYLIYVTFYFLITCQCCQENQAPGVALRLVTEKEYTPYLVLCNLSPYKTLISHLTVVATKGSIACVASVSVRFRSKERGTRVKDRAKNGSRLI